MGGNRLRATRRTNAGVTSRAPTIKVICHWAKEAFSMVVIFYATSPNDDSLYLSFDDLLQTAMSFR